MKQIKNLSKPLILIMIGGFSYVMIELLYRGYSHWTMFLVGGLAFFLIGCINEYIEWHMPLYQQMFIGMLIITALEFITGYIVNVKLGWNVWDYSNLPLNIMGQICIPFCLIWYFLSVVGIVLDDFLRYWIWSEEKPHYHLFRKCKDDQYDRLFCL